MGELGNTEGLAQVGGAGERVELVAGLSLAGAGAPANLVDAIAQRLEAAHVAAREHLRGGHGRVGDLGATSLELLLVAALREQTELVGGGHLGRRVDIHFALARTAHRDLELRGRGLQTLGYAEHKVAEALGDALQLLELVEQLDTVLTVHGDLARNHVDEVLATQLLLLIAGAVGGLANGDGVGADAPRHVRAGEEQHPGVLHGAGRKVVRLTGTLNHGALVGERAHRAHLVGLEHPRARVAVLEDDRPLIAGHLEDTLLVDIDRSVSAAAVDAVDGRLHAVLRVAAQAVVGRGRRSGVTGERVVALHGVRGKEAVQGVRE
mmetsp:Transcript_3727/g.9049  ORF Transcript_3727/g.9049 Transcript_3727/m.9049 type:complete len:322 (-) Transcript_3727:598-1563(-)